jgi:hypothetical protein
VQWHTTTRKEHYAIFAKSFKKKTKEKNVYCFDLKDLKKAFKKMKNYFLPSMACKGKNSK